jgi:hypothetical protein
MLRNLARFGYGKGKVTSSGDEFASSPAAG